MIAGRLGSRLQAILPICSYCRKIRGDENYWDTVENYISAHTSTLFSHSFVQAAWKDISTGEYALPGARATLALTKRARHRFSASSSAH